MGKQRIQGADSRPFMGAGVSISALGANPPLLCSCSELSGAYTCPRLEARPWPGSLTAKLNVQHGNVQGHEPPSMLGSH